MAQPIKVVKAADRPRETEPAERRQVLTAYEIRRAKIKCVKAIQELQFYSAVVKDPEFQEFYAAKIETLGIVRVD
jgi:hypothetical protein